MKLKIGCQSDVGRARQANEDSFLRDDDGRVFAVADGMGGHRAGDVASSTALEAFETQLGDGADLVDAIVAANDAVFEKAEANPELRGMGTTVTALRFADERAFVGHVGDSRAYLLRDGELTQVTEDHSLVEELVREGRLSPEEAAIHPQRSIITRALGVDETVDVATYEVDLRAGDRLIVCSDGLTSMVRDDLISRVLRAELDPQKAADRLVAAANRAGGEDNITVLVIDVNRDRGEGRKKALAASLAVDELPDEATGEWEQEGPPEVEVGAGARAGEVPAAPGKAGAPRDVARTVRRAALWGVPFVLVVIVAVGALAWYARSTYFVGLDEGRVVVYRGVPDGFLVWDPTVEELTQIRASDLTPNDRDDLADGHRFANRSRADEFVDRLERSTTTTTTTTRPTPTTTPPGPTTTNLA